MTKAHKQTCKTPEIFLTTFCSRENRCEGNQAKCTNHHCPEDVYMEDWLQD